MDISRLLKRQNELNVIAFTVIAALLATVALLVFVIMTGIPTSELWLLRDQVFRTLATGLLLMVIVYLADQHRRLRARLAGAHDELEAAQADIAGAYDRLVFSHHAATIMTSLTQSDGLKTVLQESVSHFAVDAAAVVGDEITITTAEGVDPSFAESAVLEAALETVRAGKAMSSAVGADGSIATAVPLRVRGQLKSVIALWRRGCAFTDDELDGLNLLARIIELGLENRALLDETRTQLTGIIRTMVDLVERRRPSYARRSVAVADLAVAVGESLGMREQDVADLRLAAMLRDVGMLHVPESILGATRALISEDAAEVPEHPVLGADLALGAGFDEAVRQAILFHHERLNGTGYPEGRRGDRIPLAARVLAACDSYVAMTSAHGRRRPMSTVSALNELRSASGVAFDPRVIQALIRVRSTELADVTASVAHGYVPLSDVEMRTELASQVA